LTVCSFIGPLAYYENLTSKFHQIFCTCFLWPLLGLPLTAMRYVMYFRFVDGVMFLHNRANVTESETTLK